MGAIGECSSEFLPIKYKFMGAFFSVREDGLKLAFWKRIKKKKDSQTQVQLTTPLPRQVMMRPKSEALILAVQQQQRAPPQPRCTPTQMHRATPWRTWP